MLDDDVKGQDRLHGEGKDHFVSGARGKTTVDFLSSHDTSKLSVRDNALRNSSQ